MGNTLKNDGFRMKSIIPLLVISLLFMIQTADAARGRQPCSGSKGGISHCASGGAFVCNDGSLSQSKRFCSGYGAEPNRLTSNTEPTAMVTKKTQRKKSALSAKKQGSPHIVENDDSLSQQPKKPTCAPIYMADKPGFTQLPICFGDQF
jgi:hypothetical protein